MRYLAWLPAVWLLAAVPVAAGEYVVPLMAEPPIIDGLIDPAEWALAARIDGFAWEGSLEWRRATACIGATSTHLYVAISSQLPTEGGILADVHRDSENLVFDDSIEVWVDPTFGAERGLRYQMLANSLGHRYMIVHPYGGERADPAWRGDWPMANQLREGLWQCEIAIPLEQIAPGARAEELTFGINVCRNWKQEWAFSSMGGGGYAPTDSFRFVADAVVPHFVLGDGCLQGEIEAGVRFSNATDGPQSIEVELLLNRDLMPPIHETVTLTLQPGQTEEALIRTEDRSTRRFGLKVEARDAATGGVLLSREVAWAAGGPSVWTTQPRVIEPVDLQFAYYPYSNRLRVIADVSNLPPDAVLDELVGVVREAGGPEIASMRFDNLVDGRQEVWLELPPLEGAYEIALRASGEGVPETEVVRAFERTRFEWEGGGLGGSEAVYPPFTPIEVSGKQLSTVLREHLLGDSGLWDQVTAKGRDVLAGPMRWEAVVNGQAVPVQAAGLAFDRVSGFRTTADAGFAAGGLRSSVRQTWDYDGTMRLDMELAPTGATVDALTLVIPLDDAVATHYHAMGDGIRNTLYDRIPEGEGVVWTAEQTRASDLPERFCTYLYVGSPVRGLCWFAENDAGWGWDPSTPNVELLRAPGEVQLRVHLINTPTVIEEARRITFGLLAAPVKPRLPGDWRHKWRRDRYSLLGTDINWLALGDCGSVYPAGKDLWLWEMIARGNRERLSEEEIQATVDRARPYFERYGPDKVASLEAHVRHNLTSRFGTKMVFYYNRASYQAAEEFETFKDEWGLTDTRAIGKGDGIWEIKIVPSDSYIDHALYWYGRSFDIGGNQGVYWDNWFFVGSYNTAMTGAYARPNGTIVPSTGIWGLRELARRTFQYMNERGMFPAVMAHMTSTAILPMLSFCTIQYDWEWKYSEGDVQGRFPREYLLMVSNGELAGTWPVILGDHGPEAEDPWVARTFAACAMVHELDCSYAEWSEVGRSQLALFEPIDRLLAEPDLHVYTYWGDEPQPVTTEDPDVPTIVYSVPGREAVFAAVSYADRDVDTLLRVDTTALGLGGDCRVINAETGDELPLVDGEVALKLARHDVLVGRVEPR